MVARLLNVLHREIRDLHEAAYLLGVFAVFSQILALLRDRLLAHSFGAGATLDVYFAAFRIPDLIFAGIASLVSVYVLIPFLSERIERSEAEARAFVGSMFTFFLGTILVAALAAFLAAPLLVALLFSGIEGSQQADLILLTRILLLQPILLGVSSLFASITQTYRKFLLYAVSPLLYNLGIILGIVFLYPSMGIAGLGWGVIAGALLHAGIQLPFIARSGVAPWIRAINWKIVGNVVRLSLPRTLALSGMQFALLALVALASRLEAGSVAIFTLAFNLQFVPISIIGVSYSVAAFPTLTRLFSGGNREQFFANITTAARHIIFWSLPIIALFIVLRAQIVRVILGSGQFDWQDTRLTAAAVALFVVSLAAHSLVLLFVRGYYAAGNTRTPVVLNITSALLVVAFAYGFLWLYRVAPDWRLFVETLLRVEGIPGTAVLMLPLGYALAMLLNATALLIAFQRDFKEFSHALQRVSIQSGIAAIIGGLSAYIGLAVFDDVFDISTFLGIFLQGFLAGVIGIIAIVATLRALGSRELEEVWNSLRRRFWRQEAIAPEQLDQ